MCSETSPPRLSFSHDISELQILPIKNDLVSCKETLLLDLDSNSDFEFITSSNTLDFESCSSADEIFSNGMILPIQIQQDRKHTHCAEQEEKQQHHHHNTKLPPRPFSQNVAEKMKKETIRELLQDVNSSELHEKKPHYSNKSSFWGFSRSKSLNCDDTKKSLICSLPLLSRSNSTGSAQNPKKMSSNKQQSASKSSSPTTTSSCSNLNFLYPVQKSSSGKSYGGSYGNGVRVSPVLNVPTPYVSSKGSSNMFGLGSFLRVGKVMKSKK